MTRLYCPECSEYLEGGDGECHDCSCGWKQAVDDQCFSGELDALKAESAALQKENAELKEAIKKQSNAVNAFYAARSSEDKNRDVEIIRLRSLDADNKGLKECNAILTDENAAQAKRIEQQDEIIKATLEVIEATADFARDFYKQADKKSETRVAVPTFKELERRLRTYLPTSKNGE